MSLCLSWFPWKQPLDQRFGCKQFSAENPGSATSKATRAGRQRTRVSKQSPQRLRPVPRTPELRQLFRGFSWFETGWSDGHSHPLIVCMWAVPTRRKLTQG